MNYFFKYLVPQLLKYFNEESETVLSYIPKMIQENYKKELEIELKKNFKNSQSNKKAIPQIPFNFKE